MVGQRACFVVCLLIRCFGSHSVTYDECSLLVCTESEPLKLLGCCAFAASCKILPKTNKSETILNSQRSTLTHTISANLKLLIVLFRRGTATILHQPPKKHANESSSFAQSARVREKEKARSQSRPQTCPLPAELTSSPVAPKFTTLDVLTQSGTLAASGVGDNGRICSTNTNAAAA